MDQLADVPWERPDYAIRLISLSMAEFRLPATAERQNAVFRDGQDAFFGIRAIF